MDIYEKAQQKIDQIEAELRHLGRWQTEPLPPEKFENMGAFGMNTMSVEQWIQFILVPRVHEVIEEQGEFPKGSAVATYAIRNLDGDNEANELISLLSQFDALFN